MIINELFQSFIATDQLTLDNASIENFCYDKIKNDPARISSPNQSNVSDLERNGVIKPLLEQVQKRIDILRSKYDLRDDIDLKITNIWINLNHPNAAASPHKHPGHLFTGVYYVKCTDSGALEIFNPIPEHQWVVNTNIVKSRNSFTSQIVAVQPVVGKLVIFPSWLMHYIKPNLDEKDRISIAFDVDAIV